MPQGPSSWLSQPHCFLLSFTGGQVYKTKICHSQWLEGSSHSHVPVHCWQCGILQNGKIIPRSSPPSVLLTCDLATLKITNQKNGRMWVLFFTKKQGRITPTTLLLPLHIMCITSFPMVALMIHSYVITLQITTGTQ